MTAVPGGGLTTTPQAAAAADGWVMVDHELVGSLTADRRWRWLLAGGGLGAIAAVWVVGLAEAMIVVAGVRLLVAGAVGYRHIGAAAAAPGGLRGGQDAALAAGSHFLAGVIVCALAGVLSVVGWLALRDLTRRRPWLLVAWQAVFHSRRSRFDSAGFVAVVYAAAGCHLDVGAGCDAAAVYRRTQDHRVPLEESGPGDMVFWAGGSTSDGNPEGICHVAIHLGGGQVAHAGGGTAGGVAIESTARALIAPDRWPAGRPYAVTRPSAGAGQASSADSGSGELASAGSAPGGLRRWSR